MQLLDYISRQELEIRWERTRRYMECDALIVLQNVGIYYLTGSTQTGVLWFPKNGEPLFAVRKSFERGKSESALTNIVPFKSYSELPSLLPAPGQTLGFELDVVPVATYEQVAKYFKGATLVDASLTIRRSRGVKTAYEIDCIRQAARQLDKAFLDIPGQLREGMAEIDLGARIEYVMRSAGHQGLTRVRRFNMEMHYGAVSFGDTAAYPHSFDGPVGVRGLYTAVPAMGGRKQLRRGEPVIVDIVGGCAGYIADGTRVYALGELSQELRDAHAYLLDLNGFIEDQLRPGRIPGEIYTQILERVSKSRYGAQFMGAGENQVKFVAHSVGLELDELPVIAPKYDAPFEVNTVMAVEPKIFFPGVGGVGTENTYVIRDGAPERLTTCDQEIYTVQI
jgi:Xaa-Pro dipeptidase